MKSAVFRQASLRTWLTTVVLAALLSAVLACSLLMDRMARSHAEQAALDTLTDVAGGFRDDLERGMEQNVGDIGLLAGMTRFGELGDPASARRALDHLQQRLPQFAWVGLTDRNGHVTAATGGLLQGADVSARPWFSGARDRPYVGDVHDAVLLAKLLPAAPEPWRFVDIAFPIQDAHGERIATLGAHLSWSWARQVKADLISSLRASRQADALVIARDGTVLLGPPELEGRHWVPPADDSDYFAMMPTRARGAFNGLGWTVVVLQPQAVALADYRVLQRQILVVAAVLVLLCVPLSWGIAWRLSSPLYQLAAAIARQDHLGDTPMPRIRGYREVGLLSDALVALSERQQAQDRALHDLNTGLEHRVDERTQLLQQATRELEANERRLRTITDNLPALIAYIDHEQRVLFANATYREWMGMAPDAMMGRTMRELLTPAAYAGREPHILAALVGERCVFEAEHALHDIERTLQITYLPDVREDGSVAGFYALSADVTTMKLVERHLEQLSRVDMLTGLPNRRQFEERLDQAIARAARSGRTLALMLLDVDKFKQINDTLGHGAGDAVLKTVASRLSGCVRVTDTVARLAGDEFVIVLEGLNHRDEADGVARKILRAVREDTEAGDRVLQLSTSIGIAFYRGGPVSPPALVAQADAALYEAKSAGRNTFRRAALPELVSASSA